MIDLKAEFGSRYRITLDESFQASDRTRADKLWCARIPCKFGHIYVHSENTLGGYTNRRNMRSRLEAIEGVKVHQRGDTELVVLFSPDRLDAVCELLHARKRRRLSPERREAAVARLAATQFRRTSEQDSSAPCDLRGENDLIINRDDNAAPW